MDSFIDKFAQRKNAQELIRANAMAEAEEKEKMAAQLSEYEMAMQELRRCNLQNIENAEKVKELLTASLNKIEEVQKKDEGSGGGSEKTAEDMKNFLGALNAQLMELLGEQQNQMAGAMKRQQNRIAEVFIEQQNQIGEFLKEQSSQLEEKNAQISELIENQKKMVEELLNATEEFNHKEAVKVYRNVQAVIEKELPKQTEELTETIKSAEEKGKISQGMMVIWVLTFVAAAANVVIEILKILGNG